MGFQSSGQKESLENILITITSILNVNYIEKLSDFYLLLTISYSVPLIWMEGRSVPTLSV